MDAFRLLIEHVGILWEFLHSSRYTGEPRQLAYAMAAVPELTWRSSLDYFNRNPSMQPIHLAAMADHIYRRNPRLFATLTNDGPTLENLRRLKKCCPDCKRLAAQPERVLRALKEGQPTRPQPGK